MKKQSNKAKNLMARYNRRIDKLSKNENFAEYLPSKVTMKELNKDPNKELKLRQMQRFVDQRGFSIERIGNVKMLSTEKHDIMLMLRKVNENRKNIRAKLGVKDTPGMVGPIQEVGMKKRKLPKVKTRKDVESLKKSLLEQTNTNYFNEQFEMYKINLMIAVDRELGMYSDLVNDILQDIEPEALINKHFEGMQVTFTFTYGSAPAHEKAVSMLIEFLNSGEISQAHPRYNEVVELVGEFMDDEGFDFDVIGHV